MKKKAIKDKAVANIEKAVERSGLFDSKNKSEYNKKLNKLQAEGKNSGYKGAELDDYLQNKKIEKFDEIQEDAKVLLQLVSESFRKEAEGTSIEFGDLEAEGLTRLAENGYFQKSKEIIIGDNGEKSNSYNFTPKGEKLFKTIPEELVGDYVDKSPNAYLETKKAIGFAKMTVKRINTAEKKRKTGTLITDTELVQIADSLLKDRDLKTVEELSSSYEAGVLDEVDGVKLQKAISSLSGKYDLKIDEIKAFNDLESFKEAVKVIDEAKKDGFLKISQIKNSVAGRRNKPASIAGRLGLSTAFVKSIGNTLDKITPETANKQIQIAKNKLKAVEKKIRENKKKTDIEKDVIIKLERNKFKQRELELKAKSLSVAKTKTLILKRLKDLELDPRYKGVKTDKIISQITRKETWTKANTGPEIEKQLQQIYKKIDLERFNTRRNYLEKLLKLTKNRSGAQYSAEKIRIDAVLSIKGYEAYFKANKGELDIEVIDQFISDAETLVSRGRESLLKEKYEKSRETLGVIGRVRKDLYDKDGNRVGGIDGFKTKNADKSSVTPKQFVKKVYGKWSSATFFIPREFKKIFNGNKEAFDILVTRLKREYDKFEVFEEKYTRLLLDNLEGVLGRENMEEWGDFMLARRRVIVDGETVWLGLDRMHYDKTSPYNKPSDKYLNDPIPKGFEDMSLEDWDKIKKTELAGVMIKGANNPKFLKATELRDKYHKITAKLYQKAQVEVDNKYTESEKYYFGMNYEKGGKAQEINDLGDSDFSPNFLDKSGTKLANTTIEGDIIMDNNPVNVLLGVEKKTRTYGFLAEAFKDAKDFYDGPSKATKDLTIKEINDLSKDENSKLTENGDEIEVTGNLVNGDTEVSILRKVEALKKEIIEGTNKTKYQLDSKGRKIKEKDSNGDVVFKWEEDTVSVNKIKAHVGGRGIKEDLNLDEQHSVREYLNKVARGGNVVRSDGERIFNRLANHYNRLPLMGSISVFAKQGLSLIDGIGKVGVINYKQALEDLARTPEISKFLNSEVIEIHNRALDPIDKELKNLKLDKHWAEKVASKYEKYTEFTMKPIQYADRAIYKAIWTASLRKNLVDRKIIGPREPLTLDIIKKYNKDFTEIGIEADSIASSAHPLMTPRVYNNVFQKAFFGIFTSQLNRMQIILNDVPDRYKSGDKSGAIFEATMLMTSNIMETAVTLAIGKYIYSTLGITEWAGYEEDFLDLLVSTDTAIRISVGQTFWWSKLTGAGSDFGVAPLFGGLGKTATGLFEVKDALVDGGIIDAVVELGNFISENLGGKVIEQLYNIVENRIIK